MRCKAQARDLLGIDLTDADVGNVPLLATDPYGKFVRGPNGFPQVVMRTAGPTASSAPPTTAPSWSKAIPLRRSASPTRCAPATRSSTTSRTRAPSPRELGIRRRCSTARRRRRRRQSRPTAGRGAYDDELLERALHRRRRPRQREHRPDRRAPRVPRRAQPAGRAHQGRRRSRAATSRSSTAICSTPVSEIPADARRPLRVERRAPVPGRQVRHRDAVPAPGVRGVRAQDPAERRRVPRAERLRRRRSIRRSWPSSRTPCTASAIRC